MMMPNDYNSDLAGNNAVKKMVEKSLQIHSAK